MAEKYDQEVISSVLHLEKKKERNIMDQMSPLPIAIETIKLRHCKIN